MKETEFLPIGSIVVTKGNTKKLMIVSRAVVVKVDNQRYLFDYGACMYPEGVLDDKLLYFNNQDIMKIIFNGFSDDENQLAVMNIQEALSTTDIPQGNPKHLYNKFRF